MKRPHSGEASYEKLHAHRALLESQSLRYDEHNPGSGDESSVKIYTLEIIEVLRKSSLRKGVLRTDQQTLHSCLVALVDRTEECWISFQSFDFQT